MFHDLTLKDGAVLVADAHYSSQREELFGFFKAIESKEIDAPQLILMGDVFDALFGQISYTHMENAQIVSLLNRLSQKIEIIYLEGNHDFNLKNIFPQMKIFSFTHQPISLKFNNLTVLLAHGDILNSKKYSIYTKIIRNPITLYLLSFLDFLTNHSILKLLYDYLSKKDDCREFVGFEEFMQKRLAKIDKCDYFVEGHFHQNKGFLVRDFRYFNLGAFACNQRYFVVESSQEMIFFTQKQFLEGKVV